MPSPLSAKNVSFFGPDAPMVLFVYGSDAWTLRRCARATSAATPGSRSRLNLSCAGYRPAAKPEQ